MKSKLNSSEPPDQTTSFYGWRLVTIGTVMNALVSGFYGKGFTVYFLALARDLKLSHASTSLVFGLSSLEDGIQSPITGIFIDRWGPRIMMLLGALLAGVGFLLLPLARSFEIFLLIFIGVISLGANTGFHNCSAAIVTRWFIRKRGKAFGITSMGIAIGASLLTPLVAFMVMNHGWRMSSFLSGIALLVIGLPLAAMVKNSPEELGQTPDGVMKNTLITESPEVDFRVRDALRTWSYWLIAIGITLRISANTIILVHIVPLMVWKGMGESAGAMVIASGSLTGIAIRFGSGWLGDFWPKRKLVSISMVAGAVSAIFLIYSPGTLSFMLIFALILSITEGAAGLTWAMIGDYFGRTSYATLRGGVNALVSIGGLAAPVIAGIVFDSTSSYYLVLWPCSILYIFAAIVFMIMPDPRPSTYN